MARCLRETRWEMADRHRPGHSDREAVNGAVHPRPVNPRNNEAGHPAHLGAILSLQVSGDLTQALPLFSASRLDPSMSFASLRLHSVNGAIGMSDIEGKAAREAVRECGQRASFNRARAAWMSSAISDLVTLAARAHASYLAALPPIRRQPVSPYSACRVHVTEG
jgi:hypothetical protein